MIWRWATFSSALAAAAVAAHAATFTGQVELRDSRERSVQREHDYSGVVVWLEPAAGKAPDPAGPLRATMLQKNKKFIPHVLAVRRGTLIDFPNQDPIFHNAFSNFSGQVFDIGLYAPGSSRPVRFDRPGIVRIFCNIHSSMSAVIAVLNTVYFATTTASGEFLIPAVPPGEYTLHFFHERATPQTLRSLERSVTIDGDATALTPVSISESDYLPAPHKNKYGRDYPPAVDDGYVPGSR